MQAEAAVRSPLKRALRAIGIAVIVVLALAALAWAALPSVLRHVAAAQLTERLGRLVTVGRVDVRPWALSVSVEDLVVGRAAGDTTPGPQARIGRLFADVSAGSSWQFAPVLEALRVEQPELHVARLAPQRWDVDDILQRLQAAPPPEEPSPDDAPPRLALYNLQLADGVLTFDDRPVGKAHRLEGLQLGLPYLSTLPADVDVQVQPRLAFTLNGTRFDTGAAAKPFAPDRPSQLTLNTGEIDLAPWLPYLPADLPLRPAAGRVAAQLQVQFSQPSQGPQAGRPQVQIAGQVNALDLELRNPAGEPMLAWKSLRVPLADVQPLRQLVRLGAVELDGLQVRVGRSASGQWLYPGAAPARPTGAAKPAAPAASPASAPAAPPAEAGWQFALQSLQLKDAGVAWQDAAAPAPVDMRLSALEARLDAFSWPLAGEAQARITAALQAQGQAAGQWTLEGTVRAPAGPPPQAANAAAAASGPAGPAPAAALALSVDGFELSALQPYLQAVLAPRLDGRVAAQAKVQLATLDGALDGADLRLDQLRIDGLRLSEARSATRPVAPPGRAAARGLATRGPGPWPALERFEVQGVALAPASRRVSIERVSLLKPQWAVSRSADGRFPFEDWMVGGGASGTSGPRPAPAPATSGLRPAPAPAWQVQVGQIGIDGARLAWRDAAVAGDTPAALDLDALTLQLRGLQWPPRGSSAMTLAARIQAPAPANPDANPAAAAEPERTAAAAGSLRWAGQLSLEPLALKGRLTAERLPVHAVQPYLPDSVPVDVLRALLGYQGELAFRQAAQGPAVSLRGDARLTDLRVHARGADGATGAEELLGWQALEVPTLALQLEPGAPLSVETGEMRLTDLYARLVVTEQGRFILSDAGTADTPATPEAAASAPALAAAPAASMPASAPSIAAAPATAASSPAPRIAVAGVQLTNARVDFSDRFIRPNYSAALTELNGRLGAFRSGSTEMAALELRGRAAGTALLEIRGSLNPTAQPLALDIQARASDLELAPLSPYAGKYAGYAIERGKLTMDVKYNIQPDGKLAASNQIILNQLTFGERIESKDATKLPVRLAVALLTDRNGVIDINLPISGSINDPQFSLGGVILRVIVNLLVKAVTAPFALLSGGSDELSVVEFIPGTAQLAPAATAVVDKVAKSLTDRPALRMTVTGAADPASERQAMQRAALEARLAAEARREAVRAGVADAPAVAASGAASGAALPAALPAITDSAQRERLLRQVYKDTKLPDKPRNLVGLAKDLPPAEMEALLMGATVVSTDTARDLALQRGLAVRDALVARGLGSERLFLAAPKLRASGEDDAAWTPRVQLSLSDR